MQKIVPGVLVFILLLVSLSAYVSGLESIILPWSVWVFLLICINLAVWQKLMRLATFTLLVIWSYAFLGNLIPQSASGPAVAMGEIERAPAAFVAAGDAVFHSKGKCSTCHTIGEGATTPRCPDLENIGISAVSRKPGMSIKEYLVESLYIPSAYLVQGYGSIMPEVWKPPVSLTPLEIEAVIAFLQSRGGEPDVSPIIPPIDITAFEEAPQRELKGDPLAGKILFDQELQCIKCHKVGELGGEGIDVGPDLTEIGALNTVDYIEESIIEPDVKIVRGFGWTTLLLKSGEELNGAIIKQDEETLTLKVEVIEEDWDWNDEDEVESDETATIEERVIAREDIAIQPIASTQNLAAQGYFWIQMVVNDTINVSGTTEGEDRTTLTIKSGDEMVKIAKNKITNIVGRQIHITSKMPKYDDVITLRQFEDLMTYLAGLKGTE